MQMDTHASKLPALRRKVGFFALKASIGLILWVLLVPQGWLVSVFIIAMIFWALFAASLLSIVLWGMLWLAPPVAKLARQHGPATVQQTVGAAKSSGQWAITYGPGILGRLLVMLYQAVAAMAVLVAYCMLKGTKTEVEEHEERFHYGADGTGPHQSPHLNGKWYVGDEEYYR